MKAWISGGCGFVGTNLAARLLVDGHDVTLFDDLSRRGSELNLGWLKRDGNKRLTFRMGSVTMHSEVTTAMKGADVVFHLAAQTAVTTSLANPRKDFAINASGTMNVLEAAREMAKPPIVLYTSTNKVYGDLLDFPPVECETRYAFGLGPDAISEKQPLVPYTPYGCSKACADQYCLDYHRIYQLPTIVFRMSCIYGPHQHGTEDQGWIHHMAKQAAARKEIRVYGNGKQVRDCLYVDDLVEAMLAAVEKIKVTAGQAYNIGGGPENTISIRELAKMIQSPPFDLKPYQISTHPERPGDQKIYVSDIRKAKQDFGWAPKVSVPDGLERMVNSWQTTGSK